ncbi:TetR family transcriptional regulator [Gordonia rubripertincta]|uniref:TetR family transcriptional regulator n=1 Tax=Gordonia rubripertincta TaxID=36822 RepID=A0AAW6R3F6_GORRU|nr:TetR family transcriptional regulator [Gordonia rubripertincta]MDG6780277.1 TetR family transcriptional regulator [Gordonia rubripertincta]NKY63564.1 TetR family transcriptional regulator [Gordonia rubripertincta]
MHPSGLREAKKAATRKALARAVLRLSTRDGIDHVTIDAVAAEANVSVRTFHNYFGGKEDALLHLVDLLLDSVIERFEARPAEESSWCSVRTAVIETATSLDVGEPAEIVALLRLLDTDPALTARSRDMDLDQTVEARLTQLYAGRGQRTDAMYPHLVVHTAITAARVALEFFVARGRPDLPTVLESAFDQMSAGLEHPVPLMNHPADASHKEP